MLSMTTGLEAQRQEQYIAAADSSYNFGDYANAAYYYTEALDFDSTRQDLRFRLGESNLLYRSYKRALRNFDRIERDGDSPSFPRLPYLQGKAAQPLGLYDVAIDHYSLFLTDPGNAPAQEIADAKRQLVNAEWAKGIVAAYEEEVAAGTQTGIFPIHYTDVNTRYDDFGPFFERDQFYFSSLRFRVDKDNIKPTRKVARILQRNAAGNEALNRQLPEQINQKNRTAAHSAFNPAGTMVYFTYCEYVTDTLKQRCDLYSASVDADGEWGPPQKLGINVDGANNTSPNVGVHPDGSEYLYFASDRSGGAGMHDLYRTPIGADGALGEVEPLSGLNTPFDDVTPFYNSAQRELYFSTDGRKTLGGLDVYRAIINKNGWIEPPIHMGLPTNSSYNDVYYARFEEHDFGYFASNRHSADAIFWDEDEEVCCNDIYKVEIERICLEVTTWHEVTKEELDATTVTFYEEFPNGERVELAKETHPEDNLYTFEVEKGRNYFVKAVKRGFKGDEAIVEMPLPAYAKTGSDECIKVPLYLPPPTITLEVITFNKIDSTALDSCTVALSSGPDNGNLQEGTPDTKANDNFYAYNILLERYYEVFGSKPDYTSDSAIVDTRGLFILNDTIIERKLFLEPVAPPICDVQPKVFFHNDIPVKNRPFTSTTNSNYMTTYGTYLGQQDEYEGWASANANAEIKSELTTFFRDSVKKGGDDLKEFAAMLKANLAKGNSLTVTLKGLASPLAKPDYNDMLSARRGISVINYLWQDAALKEYMKNAVILVFKRKKIYPIPATYLGIRVVSYSISTTPRPPDHATWT